MHELSVALGIVRIAETEARKAGAERVAEVVVDIGRLSGVVRESLEFVFESAATGTLLENARLVVNEIQGRARCRSCDTEYAAAHLYTGCPECGSMNSLITAGRELQVKSILVEEDHQDQTQI